VAGCLAFVIRGGQGQGILDRTTCDDQEPHRSKEKGSSSGGKNASNFYYPRTCTALHFRRNPQSKIVHEAAVDLSRGQAEEREELKERKIKRQIRRMVSAVDDSPSGSRRKGRRTP